MAAKIKLTRPELKRQRDRLARYERYLPMLKLKQQQLQITLRDVARRRGEAEDALGETTDRLRRYQAVRANLSGIPLAQLARPDEIRTARRNVAGIEVPVFQDAVFPEARYSLFGTPAWVDQTLADLREQGRRQAALDVLREEERLLLSELTRIIQRVNLFEKIIIPEAREAIRMIRIKLGDEMAAAVGRAKIAKNKLEEAMVAGPQDAIPTAEPWEAEP
jgi:V/A-type H+-transporting ATPase subunit D